MNEISLIFCQEWAADLYFRDNEGNCENSTLYTKEKQQYFPLCSLLGYIKVALRIRHHFVNGVTSNHLLKFNAFPKTL